MGFPFGGNALPALLAAASWGVGDFSGGMGVRTGGGTTRAALRFIVLSHSCSLLLLVLLALATGAPLPHGLPLVSGLLAGLTGGFALVAFYLALARGAMGTSAAISGLLAAAVPAAVSASMEGAPGPRHLLGFAVAALAIYLIGAEKSATPAGRGTVLLAIASGAGFGLFFVALRFASPAGLLWPLATSRLGSVTTSAAMLTLLGRATDATPSARKLLRWVLGSAAFDTAGNLLFLAATRAGRLDVAAVLASLYPASTILLAAALLREWPSRRQGAGMLVAAAAVLLIVL